MVCRASVKHMKEGSCIINTTSVTCYRGMKTLLDYSSTKGAITTFTYSLAQNLVERGIRVNGVAPGPIWYATLAAVVPTNPRVLTPWSAASRHAGLH